MSTGSVPVVRRVLVAGPQSWDDKPAVRDALAEVWGPGVVLVSGASTQGAAALCEQCWSHWGGVVERHSANWGRYGNRAEPHRDAEMVEKGADLCLAFIRDRSDINNDIAVRAEQMNIPTLLIPPTSHDRGVSTVSQQPKPRVSSEVPISQLPHLADAAARRGHGNRMIQVDPPKEPSVRTPGRSVGQWLRSGQPLPPQYVTEAEVVAAEQQAKQQSQSSNAFVDLSVNAFAAGREEKGMTR